MDFVRPPVFHTDTTSAFRIAILFLAQFISAIWLKYVMAAFPLGLTRVLVAVPIFVVQIVSPWFFDKDTEPLQVFCIIFILSWLGSFKVLAFCWGRAPLRESMSVAQITAALALPLFPKPPSRNKSGPEGRLQDSAGEGPALVGRWLAKTALLVVVVLSYTEYREVMPVVLNHYLLAFTIYSMSGIIMDGPAAIVVELLGLPVLPTFDQPWMSASLGEFWARRWNIPTTSVLRTVLYDTCVEGSLVNPNRLQSSAAEKPATPSSPPGNEEQKQHVAPDSGIRKDTLPVTATAATATVTAAVTAAAMPSQTGPTRQAPSILRRQLGLHVVFFVSGAVHEYMAWLLTGSDKWGWKWTLFFWIQAPMITLEAICGRLLRRRGVQIPRALAILLTHLVLEGLAYELFFGYMEEQGIAQQVLGAIAKCIWGLLRPLQSIAVGLLGAYRL